MSRSEVFTIELSAAELPDSVLARFRERPADDVRFKVTIEPASSRAEKLAALRRDIDQGLADLESGRTLDGETVFAELKKRITAA